MLTCKNCGAPLPARHRVYCATCSRRASAIWKAKHRRIWSAEWRTKREGPPPWLDGWANADARRRYYRLYMRRWRLKKRQGGRVTSVINPVRINGAKLSSSGPSFCASKGTR